jgi:hypothetical protein
MKDLIEHFSCVSAKAMVKGSVPRKNVDKITLQFRPAQQGIVKGNPKSIFGCCIENNAWYGAIGSLEDGMMWKKVQLASRGVIPLHHFCKAKIKVLLHSLGVSLCPDRVTEKSPLQAAELGQS